MKKIRIFSSPSCPYCHLLQEYLKEKGVKFEVLDVSKDEEALKELKEKTGALSIPVVEIEEEIIIGFDKAKINSSLKIKE